MTAKIDAFIAEIRARPEFIAGVAADPKKADDLSAIENGIAAIERKAEQEPAIIDVIDRMSVLVARPDLTIKQRLLRLCVLFTEARDIGRSVH